MFDINTIDELVDALGGDTVTAEWLGISQSAVANWKLRGQIASGWHLRLYAKIGEMGLSINPSVFGLDGVDLAGAFKSRKGARATASVR